MSQEAILTCPKCQSPMRKLQVDDAFLDRCEGCHGVWVDADERLLTKQRKIAEVLDFGDVAVGRTQDRITDIACPKCDTAMEHRKHPDQKHIGFEQCPQCGGRYFDAGELRDLATFSLSDLVRGVMRR